MAWLRARTIPRAPLLVYGWAQLILLCWWAVNFPAQLSIDSTTYIRHVTVGPWIADHSVLYDFFVLCSLKLTGNVWLLALIQTIVYAAALALIATRIHQLGVRWRWAALPCVLIVFVPTFGSFTTMIWKDAAFAAANLFLAATLLKLIAARRAGVPFGRPMVLTLAVEMAAVTLFRNNGFVVVILVAFVLIIALKGARLKMTAAAAAAIVVFEFAGAVVYPAVGIEPANSSQSYGVFDADIALVYAKNPSAFTSADLAVMQKAAPLNAWRTSDNCYTSDTLFKKKSFNYAQANAHRHQLAELWFSLLKRDPVDLVSGHLCRAAIAWRVRPTTSFGGLPPKTNWDLYTKSYVLGYTDAPPLPGYLIPRLRPHPISWRIYNKLAVVRYDIAKTPLWQLLFSRAAGWSYLAYLAILVAAIRNRWKTLLIAAVPILANQLTIMVANPAQLFRYTVVQLFLGMLFIPVVAARSRDRSNDAATASPVAENHPATAL
ncbi:DUF6020 family protein [Flexivirga alba]|uniref:DUF6020 family protein n=1 Tax=Flexivirga alba TaxID=702742 RepID=A0ABW2AF76_9MICO